MRGSRPVSSTPIYFGGHFSFKRRIYFCETDLSRFKKKRVSDYRAVIEVVQMCKKLTQRIILYINFLAYVEYGGSRNYQHGKGSKTF